MPKGLFITFEGGENTGKSTQIHLLYQYLTQEGYDVVSTREPGGTKGAEVLRHIILHETNYQWSHLSELLLFYTARNDHIEKIITPALQNNKIVLCDRFFDSSHVYQNELKNDHAHLFKSLDQSIIRQHPNRSYFFNLTTQQWIERQKNNINPDSFEKRPFAFHKNILNEFYLRAQNDRQRCKIIDASDNIETIQNILVKDIKNLLKTYTNKNQP